MGNYINSTQEDEVWIAENQHGIVGFFSIYPKDNFIHNLFVHPKSQGKGVGKALLDHAEQNLAKPMTLKVALNNANACGFYEHYGWHLISVHKNAPEPYWLYGKN
jgi:ribosomal protein S18 acetylase RimI-like enzyme